MRAWHRSATGRSVEAVLASDAGAAAIFARVRAGIAAIGPATVHATATQVGFGARRRFAYLWIPGLALGRGPPDVYLTFTLPRRVRSPRIKEAVEPRPGLWTHHMLLASPASVDAQVRAWIAEAYRAAL